MHFERRRFSMMTSVLAVLAATASVAGAQDKIRWDIVSLQFGGPGCEPAVCISAGGVASAWAPNAAVAGLRAKISLKGSGTFSPYDPGDVTGGGEFTIYNADQDRVLASGRYTVTELISFVIDSPFLLGIVNRITNTTAADFRNGFAVLRIAFSDGTRGILTINCAGPGTGPDPFEGVTISKGVAHFTVPEGPLPNIDANRTVFVVLK